MSQGCVLCREPFCREKDKYFVKGKSKLNLFFKLGSPSVGMHKKDHIAWLWSIGFEAAFIRESETSNKELLGRRGSSR